jgi:hypothetical protein
MEPWKRGYYEDLLQGAQGYAMQGYTPFLGQRIAGFSPLEQASFQGIGALANAGLPGQFGMGSQAGAAALGQMAPAAGMGYQDMRGIAGAYDPLMSGAMGAAQGYANQFGGLAQQAGNVQTWPNAPIQSYMNPYQQNVTDIAAREAEKMGRRQLSEVGSNAALAGAFGGSRQGLLEGDIMQGTRQNIADITQAGQRDAYQSAMGQFNADRDALLRARGMQGQLLGQGLGAAQFGFGTGLDALNAQQQAMAQANQLYQSGAGNLMGGAQTMADIGGMGQGMNIDLLNLMNQAGQQQRGVQQAALDVGYQDYLRQMQYPQQQMGFMANILAGLPATGQTDMYSFQQSPSLFNSLLGTGIGAASLYNQTQAG